MFFIFLMYILTSSAVKNFFFFFITRLHFLYLGICGYSPADNGRLESGSQHPHSVRFLVILTFFLSSILLSNLCFPPQRELKETINYSLPFWQASNFSFGIIFTCSFPLPIWLFNSLPFPYLFEVVQRKLGY